MASSGYDVLAAPWKPGDVPLTLAQALLPRARHQLLLVVLASLLVALSARISIGLPFSPVPITGQTLAVLLVGASLGSRLGALSLVAYLVEGLAGLPVFAGGASAWTPSAAGVPVIVGPTAGYLLGFVPAAWLTGRLAERGWDRRIWTSAVAMAAGNAVIYVFGLWWLARFVPRESLLVAGLLPFLPGDALKIAIAAAALPGGWALVGASRRAGERG